MPQTVPPAEKLAAEMYEPKDITLKKSGLKLRYDADPSIAQVRAAQKAATASGDNSLFVLYLAQRIALFNGEQLTIGEIQEKIRGRDYLQLTGALLGDDEKDESDNVGN